MTLKAVHVAALYLVFLLTGRKSSRIDASAFVISSPSLRRNTLHPTTTTLFVRQGIVPADEIFRSSSSGVSVDVVTTTGLPLHTFAGQVERRVVETYGADAARRVLASWRLLEHDYRHDEFIESCAEIKDANVSNCHQHCHSYVPGLTCRSFWDTSAMPWATKLRSSYETIRREFLRMNSSTRLRSKGNNVWAGALTEEAGGYGEGWSTLVLLDRGKWDSSNCHLFPNTVRAVMDSGIPAVEVFFACMKPNSSIRSHSDFTNFVLTSHLAIDIPSSGSNKCRLTVGDTTRQWINGQVMLLDTSILHAAVNESEEDMRYILMFRIWHPELTDIERNALQLIYDCLEEPDLVSDDLDKRRLAEERVRQMKAFPNLKTRESIGFGEPTSSGKRKKNKK